MLETAEQAKQFVAEAIARQKAEAKARWRTAPYRLDAIASKWLPVAFWISIGVLIGRMSVGNRYTVQPPRFLKEYQAIQYGDSVYGVHTVIDTAFYREAPDIIPDDPNSVSQP